MQNAKKTKTRVSTSETRNVLNNPQALEGHDEYQILNYLDHEEKKRAIDGKVASNEKLRDDIFTKFKETNKEDYTAACRELLQKTSDVKTEIDALLKPEDK